MLVVGSCPRQHTIILLNACGVSFSFLPCLVLQVVDLARPGLPAVQRVLGWHPLHVAAMSGGKGVLAASCCLRSIAKLAACMHSRRL